MAKDRNQRLLIKLYNPMIKLAEEINFNENIILIGNTINRVDPVLVSLISEEKNYKQNSNINFILKKDNCVNRYLKREIIDLSDRSIDNLRRAFIYYVESKVLCIFPFDDNIELQKNSYFELISRSRGRIIPFGITGKYKIDGNLKLETGPSFLTTDFDNKSLKTKCEEEVKKIIKY